MKSLVKNIFNFLKNEKLKIGLILLLFLIPVMNGIWIVKDNYYPRGDGRDLVIEALLFYNNWDNPAKISKLIDHPYNFESPFLASFVLIFYSIFGIHTKNELIINSIFLLIMTYSTYKIGEKIYNKKVGLLSALLINSFFIVMRFSRLANREFAVLAFTSLSFYLMLETNYFRNTKYSVLFGIALSATALCTYSFLIYIIAWFPIYIVYSIIEFKKEKEKKIKKNIIKNFLLFSILFFILGGLWYLLNLDLISSWFATRITNKNIILTFSAKGFLTFLTSIFRYNLGIFMGSLIILSITLKLLEKKKTKADYLLLGAFILPQIFLSPFSFSEIMVPTYFSIPIIISDRIINLNITKKYKAAILIIIVLYAMSPFVSSFTNLPILDLPVGGRNIKSLYWNTQRELNMPSTEASQMERVLKFINKDSKNDTILIVGGYSFDFFDGVYYQLVEKTNYKIYFLTKGQKDYEQWLAKYNYWDLVYFDLRNVSKSSEYVVLFFPDDDKLLPDFWPSSFVSNLPEVKNNFTLVKEIHPKSSFKHTVKIYRRIN